MSNEDSARAPSGETSSPTLRALSPRVAFVVALTCACVASALLFALANTGHSTAAGQTVAVATATPNGATPTPTNAAPGFMLFTDRADGFSIQYPSAWTYSPQHPGVQFADDNNETGYTVLVTPPSGVTLAGPTQDSSDPAAWVNYELSHLRTIYPNNFISVSDGETTREIGGVTWSGGAGVITNVTGQSATPTAGATATPSVTPTATPNISRGSGIRVQVFATVYNNQPYIIDLVSVADRFPAGRLEFFDPMLNSFRFTTATP